MKTQPDIKFYDTSSLLLAGESIFNDNPFLISSVTLEELEKIKSSANKDEETKYNARLLLRLLDTYPEKYEVIVHKLAAEHMIKEKDIDLNNDTKILSDAIYCNNELYTDRIVFVTNDLALKSIANIFFGNKNIESIPNIIDSYTGYKEVICADEELANFYNNITFNHFNLLIGEYLIIKNLSQEVIDITVWTGTTHRGIVYDEFNSNYFGKVKPYKKDIYQRLLFDSLINNQITMVKGKPGSGKTTVSLAFLMSKLEKGHIDRIIIFCNTIATAHSAKLGFYPGSRDEKLLDSQIGNLLVSKFGDKIEVERLINEGKLVLLPLSDIRGYDTSGMRAGIYISEAQNLDRTLMKLALQRIGEDSICIIDGDDQAQTDDVYFSGNNNGMRQASKIFRGSNIYGEVTLNNIYRSRIAEIADNI